MGCLSSRPYTHPLPQVTTHIHRKQHAPFVLSTRYVSITLPTNTRGNCAISNRAPASLADPDTRSRNSASALLVAVTYSLHSRSRYSPLSSLLDDTTTTDRKRARAHRRPISLDRCRVPTTRPVAPVTTPRRRPRLTAHLSARRALLAAASGVPSSPMAPLRSASLTNRFTSYHIVR